MAKVLGLIDAVVFKQKLGQMERNLIIMVKQKYSLCKLQIMVTFLPFLLAVCYHFTNSLSLSFFSLTTMTEGAKYF